MTPDFISIHAPRAGSDWDLHWSPECQSISIHAPRAGSDIVGVGGKLFMGKFQSMLPVRGATLPVQIRQPVSGISIHAPRAGSDPPPGARGSRWCNFNPCSPCGERPSKTPLTAPRWNFNPCSPCGERLQQVGHRVFVAAISIHAPRAGSDRTVRPS